ncbi:hypothetical protein ACAF59_08925 [Klebsiella aerogenes]|uniref:hypothetical protein n=1 Tax=Klebsiella aerogenes TaxID=548 RepID=UPI00292A19DB|nr:hypothetical protein [Klebsiella aerogenes]
MKTFQGMPLNPIDALGNIEDLLSAVEVCFFADDNQTNCIGTMLLELAHKYTAAAHTAAKEQMK